MYRLTQIDVSNHSRTAPRARALARSHTHHNLQNQTKQTFTFFPSFPFLIAARSLCPRTKIDTYHRLSLSIKTYCSMQALCVAGTAWLHGTARPPPPASNEVHRNGPRATSNCITCKCANARNNRMTIAQRSAASRSGGKKIECFDRQYAIAVGKQLNTR